MQKASGAKEWSAGINRNIVECKYIIWRGVKRWQIVLIETLWNVNTGGTVGAISLAIGINRNIVECK